MSEPASGSATVVFRIELAATETERWIAELHSLGTLGVEERPGPGAAATLLAYFRGPAARVAPALDALATPGVHITGPEPVEVVDWEASWRRGLRPRRIGPLWVRPSWCASQGDPELVIDPEQAFGSGEHASTRLALELLASALEPGDRVLDVGTGSGVLALAALRLGAGDALGVDVDPVACACASRNASRNGLKLHLVCGEPAALEPGETFDVVVANLLLGELLGCHREVLGRARRAVVLSGYLAAERGRLDAAISDCGWTLRRELREEQSGDHWCACLLRQARAL